MAILAFIQHSKVLSVFENPGSISCMIVSFFYWNAYDADYSRIFRGFYGRLSNAGMIPDKHF